MVDVVEGNWPDAPPEVVEGPEQIRPVEPVGKRRRTAAELVGGERLEVLVTMERHRQRAMAERGPRADLSAELDVGVHAALVEIVRPQHQAPAGTRDQPQQLHRILHVVQDARRDAQIEALGRAAQILDEVAEEKACVVKACDFLRDEAPEVRARLGFNRDDRRTGPREAVRVATLERAQLQHSPASNAAERVDEPRDPRVLEQPGMARGDVTVRREP